MRLEEALSLFVVQLDADGRSVHTIRQYERHVLLLAASIGAREIEDINAQDLARFLASPAARGRRGGGTKKPTTLNALRSSIRTFFAWAHQAGLLPRNPAHMIRRARGGPAPPRGLGLEDWKRLLETLACEDGGRDHMLFALLLGTGIRVGSAVGLKVQDVDLERAELMLRDVKGNRPAVVILGRQIHRHLRRYLKGMRSGPLFATCNGGPMTPRHVNRRLRMWQERAGVRRPVPVHGLRHSFALALYARVGDVLVVQAALGHRSIASTLSYARPSEERLRQALRA